MSAKIVVMIDGGHLRKEAKKAGHKYTPRFIEEFALSCVDIPEEIFRIHYYDCRPYDGFITLPISRKKEPFPGHSGWLDELSQKPLFAVRLGEIHFDGFEFRLSKLKAMQMRHVINQVAAINDRYFMPLFEQKGVDMRMGLDIATFTAQKTVDRICIATGDTDLIPALKHARIGGLHVELLQLPSCRINRELKRHADFIRFVEWPDKKKK